MIFPAIVLFSIFVILVSVAVVRKYEKMERSELSTYIVMISWGSLMFGLYIARLPH